MSRRTLAPLAVVVLVLATDPKPSPFVARAAAPVAGNPQPPAAPPFQKTPGIERHMSAQNFTTSRHQRRPGGCA